MKTNINLTLVYMFVFCILSSCSRDYDGGYEKLNNQENEVVFKVYSNTLGVPIDLTGGKEGVLTIKDYYEATWITKAWSVGITARCDDETVLITLEIYVNGKLKEKKSGNRYVRAGATLKG